MKKRRQHYVWKHYLSPWTSNRHIWCLRLRDGKRFAASTDNVGHRRDFYRLKELTTNDLNWVEKLIISPTAPHLQVTAKGWINIFTEPFRIKQAYEASGKKDRKLEAQLDIAINNTEEDLHERTERKAVPLLTALRDGDRSFLADEEKSINFFFFLAMQYCRTPKIMRNVVDASGVPHRFNIEAAWGLMRTILASNMGATFYKRSDSLKMTYLNAGSTVEFITGDQPIINTRAIRLPPGKQATKLELYYPLSPKVAVLFDFENPQPGSECRSLTTDETHNYNQMIVIMSDEQIYAASEQALVRANTANIANESNPK